MKMYFKPGRFDEVITKNNIKGINSIQFTELGRTDLTMFLKSQ